VAGVIIGVDQHKGTHTAVALDEVEKKLGQVRVRAMPGQVDQLRQWARAWPDRIWAIEGARGLGQLLAQQLLAAGERVVDVQPKLAARVRLLDTGQVNKNDPTDLLRPQSRRRHGQTSCTPSAQTQDQRHHIRPHDHRQPARGPPQRRGPGRANGERLCIQRGQLTPRTASSSEKPLPGRRQPYADQTATHPPQRRKPARHAS
jgi:Transposase